MDQVHSWKEKNDSWQRKMGSMETFYLSLATPEGEPVHWMIGFGVSVAYRGKGFVDVVEALKQAWKDIRHDFFSIPATVDPVNQRLVVGPDDDASVEWWLQSSFEVHDGITADQLFSNFKSQFSITLHFLPDTNELVIQAMHALLDGRGMLYLFDALFKSLSKQPKDEQTNGSTCTSSPNLTRPLDEWIKFSQSPSQQNIEDARDLFKRFVQDKPVRLPGVDFGRTPGRPVHRELSLSEKDSHRIVDACKIKGLTVTTAWHAALAIAVQKIQKEKGETGTTYTQFTTIDLRRWFPEPFRANQHFIGSLQTALPFAVDLGKESNFDKISQCLQKDYKKPFTFAHGDVSCLVPGMAMYKQMLAAGQVTPSSTPYLSSMGVVDDFISPRYGDWELTKYG